MKSMRRRLLRNSIVLTLIPISISAFLTVFVASEYLHYQVGERLEIAGEAVSHELERLREELLQVARSTADNAQLGNFTAKRDSRKLMEMLVHSYRITRLDTISVYDNEGVILADGRQPVVPAMPDSSISMLQTGGEDLTRKSLISNRKGLSLQVCVPVKKLKWWWVMLWWSV